MKILIFTNIPSPYRVDFFNELGKVYDLTVVFENPFYGERDKSWREFKCENFKAIFLNSSEKIKRINFSVLNHIDKKKYDRFIVMNFSTPTGWLEIALLKLKRIPYMIESDGGFPKTGKGCKEKFKKLIISGAEDYFSTATEHDKYYEVYGAKREKIHRYPFSSIRNSDVLEACLSKEEKKVIKNELGIVEDKIIISVGQFIYRKGFDILLEAVNEIERNIGVYIIGGKPTKEMQDYVEKNKLNNIHFIEFQSPSILKRFYCAADLFVLPTREDIWGLVVNEALANGLPIISTEKCIAALELVKEDENGYIVRINDAKQLTQSINRILKKDMQRMSEKSLEIAKKYTIETMVKAHVKVLEKKEEI